jgi:tol-pal system protein YbgF
MKIRILICLAFVLPFFGCASTEETNQLRRNIMVTNQELDRFKAETNNRIAALTNDVDNARKQMISISSSYDRKDEDTKTILGKVDELQHQLDLYWSETKKELNAMRKGSPATPFPPAPSKTPAVKDDAFEAPYKEAFEAFQKDRYEDAVKKFTEFLDSYPKTPLVPNAYFWLGESYMMLRNYDKAILYFQELVEKYPKSEMTSKALLSQAGAFEAVKDRKSSITILKRVIELFPKTEEAAIAERKLRRLNL